MRYRIPILMLALLGAASCSKNAGADDPTIPPKGGGQVEAVIGGVQTATRTSLESDGRTTRWSVGDKIALWATADAGSTFVLNAQPFTLHTFNGNYTSADFSSMLDAPMPEGTYTYYAVYPQPTSTEGTQVTYTLPATQKGVYDAACDVMTATIRGGGLGTYARGELQLNFRHLLHMIRIEIPAGRNLLGAPVKRLEIEFPDQTVTGTVRFDASDPENTLTVTGGNKLTLEFDGDGLTDTDELCAYAFVLPGELDGPIRFKAFDAEGYCSNTLVSQPIHKQLASGKVTPISITIPERRVVRLDLTCADNRLGEELTCLNATLPEGLTFTDGSSARKITPSENGHYYAEMYYNAHIPGATLGMEYESEHALLKGASVTIPAVLEERENVQFSFTVPYLFEENFDSASTFHQDDENTLSVTSAGSNTAVDLPSLPGWTGAHFGTQEGKALRICCRGEQAVWVAGSYNGRTDSPNMSNLKEGATARLRITFDYSLNRASSKNKENQHYFTLSTHTNSGPQNPTRHGVGKLGSSIADNDPIAKDLYGPNDGSFDLIDKKADYTADHCTRASRFVWEVYLKTKSPDGYYNNWVYLDNIKVQIAK